MVGVGWAVRVAGCGGGFNSVPWHQTLLASLRQVSGQPCNPDDSFAFPDHLFTFQEVEAILLENRQKTPPPAHRMTARICTYLSIPLTPLKMPRSSAQGTT